MVKSRLTWGTWTVLLLAGVTAASYWFGTYAQRRAEDRALAHTQAMLAFGHYKFYEQIESQLKQKCYEAASTDVRELKHLQLHLVAENLRATGSDPELVEYIKIRDPRVLEAVMTGQVPTLKSYTTTCP